MSNHLPHPIETLAPIGVLPVVTLHSEEQTTALLCCLHDSGIFGVEITLRTAYAPTALRRMVDAGVPVAAGTVRNLADLNVALAAGVTAVVSPGLSHQVARACAEQGVSYVPGVATGTEIMAAGELGLNLLKFFPAAQSGGTQLLAAWQGPFGDVSFVPTGGLTAETFTQYLELPNVPAVGGGWMAPLPSDGSVDLDRLRAGLTACAATARSVRTQVVGR